MSTKLPLFPLGTVLFPGQVMPLHIFEDRYRELVADLLAEPEPRQFGIIAIRHGRETGVDGVRALYRTGCTASLRQVERYEDGRYDLIAVGNERFDLLDVGEAAPYLQGDVGMLPEDVGGEAAAAAVVPAVQEAFRTYLDLISERGSVRVTLPELPDEPMLMSYLVAAAVVVDLPVKQSLLEEPDALRRLTAERGLLARECQMLRSLTATPAPDLRNMPYSPN